MIIIFYIGSCQNCPRLVGGPGDQTFSAFYEKLSQELSSATYERVGDSEDDLLKKHKDEIKGMGIDVPEDEEKLPFIYSTAKQHKDSVAQRFIVSVQENGVPPNNF